MRQTPQYCSQTRKVLHWIIGINLAVFAVQMLSQTWFHSYWVQTYFSLSIPKLLSGYVWTPITYAFLHREGFLHIGLNLLIIYLVGRALESALSPKRFLTLYLGSALGGALLWMLTKYLISIIHGIPPYTPVVGASAAAYGLLIYFCAIQPDRPITLLVFFILPVTLKPKWIALILVGFDLCGMLFFELPRNGSGTPLAHSAHLGGMAAAWLFYYLTVKRGWEPGKKRAASTPANNWFSRKRLRSGSQSASTGKFTINTINRKDLQKEVDRILDKINEQGFGALSDSEKLTLDKARDLLR